MPISKLGVKRQVVIPREICEELGLHEGDFVEVIRYKNGVLVKPKKLVDADDILTPEEEAVVRRGEEQLHRGEYITLDELERKLDGTARKRSRKTT